MNKTKNLEDCSWTRLVAIACSTAPDAGLLINFPGPQMTTKKFFLMGNIILVVVSLMVIPCKGPFDQPPHINQIWEGNSKSGLAQIRL